MKMKSRMTLQPALHILMLVRAIVVDDQMQIVRIRGLLINEFHELDELLMTMAAHADPDHLPVQHAQGSEQRGGTMTGIVV